MSKIYGEGRGALCAVYSHFHLPSEYGIDLNFRHLSSCDNIDMIEMHRNSCSCLTKTFFLLEYWEIKLNDCVWLASPNNEYYFKYKLQKTVSTPQVLTVSISDTGKLFLFWKVSENGDFKHFNSALKFLIKRQLNVSFVTFWGVKMCDKMAISSYIFKIVEKDPLLRLQMRTKETFNHHQFFSTNKQFVKIKLMQNETNRWSSFW